MNSQAHPSDSSTVSKVQSRHRIYAPWCQLVYTRLPGSLWGGGLLSANTSGAEVV
jgi:hypothetical protein